VVKKKEEADLMDRYNREALTELLKDQVSGKCYLGHNNKGPLPDLQTCLKGLIWSSGRLDLHGMYQAEAEECTKAFLKYWQKNRNRLTNALNSDLSAGEVEVIPGAGNHSIGGKAILLPAIKRLLFREGYTFHELNRHNHGAFAVSV